MAEKERTEDIDSLENKLEARIRVDKEAMDATQKMVPPVKKYSGSRFWPGEVLSEGGMMLLTIAALFFLAALLPAPLGEEANPNKTLHPIYPEWYLLSVFGIVRFWVWDVLFIPAKMIGLFVPPIVGIFILLLPFFDAWNKGSGEGQLKHIRRRKKGALISILLLIGAVVMGAMAVILEKGLLNLS
jgi:quinol-cytochrome oxidoreductase complex cytochrome b subunit